MQLYCGNADSNRKTERGNLNDNKTNTLLAHPPRDSDRRYYRHSGADRLHQSKQTRERNPTT